MRRDRLTDSGKATIRLGSDKSTGCFNCQNYAFLAPLTILTWLFSQQTSKLIIKLYYATGLLLVRAILFLIPI